MQSLVIDDSRAMRLILGRMLRELGFTVVEASNGREGLEQLEAAAPDLVLVDWNMPEMSGIEFLEAMRRPPYISSAKVVMVTTETEIPQVIRALGAGADEYLMKPFTREAVLDKLHLLGFEV
ncbi:MAG: response regulator [Actinobacteria bacterium]|nr:response regulator [Actinomycetota bacterium]MCA1720103.1 response regulator [Actinomycetota bacterium]